MTRKLDTTSERWSSGDRARGRAYLQEFVPGMVLYSALLVTALMIGNDTTAGKVLLVAVPLTPFALVTRAVVRALRRLDDYQRYLGLRSLSSGFAAAMLAGLVVGFLAVADVHTPAMLIAWLPFLAGMAAWAIAATLASRS